MIMKKHNLKFHVSQVFRIISYFLFLLLFIYFIFWSMWGRILMRWGIFLEERNLIIFHKFLRLLTPGEVTGRSHLPCQPRLNHCLPWFPYYHIFFFPACYAFFSSFSRFLIFSVSHSILLAKVQIFRKRKILFVSRVSFSLCLIIMGQHVPDYILCE